MLAAGRWLLGAGEKISIKKRAGENTEDYPKSFEALEVWQKAHELTLEIYKISDAFPPKEQFRLTNQLCRAMSSVPANIAEGKGRYSDKDYLRFLYIARGSLEETRYHLILAKDLGYIGQDAWMNLRDRIDKVGKLLNGLINSVKKAQT